jgi:hypothetical protein
MMGTAEPMIAISWFGGARGFWHHAVMFPDGFQTQSLLLRPIAMADARPIFDGYAQDPEVSHYLTWRPHTRIEQTEAYVRACLKATAWHCHGNPLWQPDRPWATVAV